MSFHIIGDPTIHMNQRAQLLESLVGQKTVGETKSHTNAGSQGERPSHTRLTSLIERFLETCPL
jgi:hypothetical protein